MKQLAEEFCRQMKAVLPDAETEVREVGEKSAWLDISVSGMVVWWEVEIRDSQFLVYSHYPNDPDDVAFAPPDDWFDSPHAAALFLKSALTIRASDPRALGSYVLSVHRDGRDRTYTFESQDEAVQFTIELIKQGVPAKKMAYYQQSPIPPAALQSSA